MGVEEYILPLVVSRIKEMHLAYGWQPRSALEIMQVFGLVEAYGKDFALELANKVLYNYYNDKSTRELNHEN